MTETHCGHDKGVQRSNDQAKMKQYLSKLGSYTLLYSKVSFAIESRQSWIVHVQQVRRTPFSFNGKRCRRTNSLGRRTVHGTSTTQIKILFLKSLQFPYTSHSAT